VHLQNEPYYSFFIFYLAPNLRNTLKRGRVMAPCQKRVYQSQFPRVDSQSHKKVKKEEGGGGRGRSWHRYR